MRGLFLFLAAINLVIVFLYVGLMLAWWTEFGIFKQWHVNSIAVSTVFFYLCHNLASDFRRNP